MAGGQTALLGHADQVNILSLGASIRDYTNRITPAGVRSRGTLCSERLSPKPGGWKMNV